MKKTYFFIFSIILRYSLLLQSQSISYNQEFRINTCTDYFQQDPSVSYLLNGGFVVCWYTWFPDWAPDSNAGTSNIYGQLFNSDGSKKGVEFQVNTYTKDDQVLACVSAISNDKFIVCWQSYGQDGNHQGIFGQIFYNDGLKYGEEFQVNTYNQSWQASPSVSAVPNDKFLVCWYSDGQDGWDSGVYGQMFNSNGFRYGGEFQINTYIESSQNNPNTSSLSNEKFVVCWESWGQDGSSAGIYAQMFNNNGTKYGIEFKVNTYTNNWQWEPCVSDLDNGRFVICWESGDQNGIYGQIFNNDGSMAGNEFRVNSNKHYYHSNPSVSNLNNGKFIVCWYCLPEDGSGENIYGQIYFNNGSKYGEEFLINNNKKSDQIFGDVSGLTDEKFVVCWYGEDQNGSSQEIFGKYYMNKLIHTLQPFSLIDPSNDITLKTTNPIFQWNKATSMRINLPWELEYQLYLDENDDFSSPLVIKAIYDTTSRVDPLTPGTTYYWKVLAKNLNGDSLWSSETNGFFVSYEVSIEETILEEPQSFQLFTNYPNPFNPETTIKFAMPADQAVYNVKIKIYDALGCLVIVLINEQQKPGIYTINWNGQNAAGQTMFSGVYFCVVQAEPFKAVQKMLLIR